MSLLLLAAIAYMVLLGGIAAHQGHSYGAWILGMLTGFMLADLREPVDEKEKAEK